MHNPTASYQIKANNKESCGCYSSSLEDSDSNCGSLLGDPRDPNKESVAYWLQWILSAIKYIAIIALFVLSIVEFIKALVANDKDALKKAGMTTAKRFAYCVILFFLPMLVELLMSLFGAYGTCGIG